MTAQQLQIVDLGLEEGFAGASDADQSGLHCAAILGGPFRARPAARPTRRFREGVSMSDEENERQINIHIEPEQMAGVYANFANVSHSDYEFTITFARIDHEVEEAEVPGVVVSKVSLSPKFMRELIEALEDNYSKWHTREGIKSLPEFPGRGPGTRAGS